MKLRNLSIHRKLTLMGLGASGCSLLLACTGFALHEVSSFREAMVHRVSTQAEIVAYNVASAVLFADREAAETTLVSLSSEPSHLAAVLYERELEIFATWTSTSREVPPLPPDHPPPQDTKGHHFRGNELHLYAPVVVDGRPVGTLLVRSSTDELNVRVLRFALIAVGVLAASILAATLFHARLQRVISDPLLELASIARHVSTQKDYSVRARPRDGDEIGLLVDAFNEMIDDVQKREEALEQRTRELQEEVVARERTQGELALQAERLIRSNRELEHFVNVASHDLQEPLRIIASFTQLLSQEYGDRLDADGREYVEFAVDGARRMQTLIRDLLSYSRITWGEEELVEVDLSAALDDALDNLSVSLSESNARVTRGPLPTVLGEPGQLTPVFQNLVGNAIKYRRGEPHIRVSAELRGEEWLVSVRDNGIGIEPQYFDRVFQMFERLHTVSEYDGTGIGLALCKKIVEGHGGRIWVESTPSVGSEFCFTVPARPNLVSAPDAVLARSECA